MSNYHLRDKNISLKAKGLLSQMLSLPEERREGERVSAKDYENYRAVICTEMIPWEGCVMVESAVSLLFLCRQRMMGLP
jgi:hypothetical protein